MSPATVGVDAGPAAARLLIFVPTYDEQENVELMCRELCALGLDADLLFMDDNSPDGTGEILDRLAAELPRLHVVHRPGKSGIGAAHLAGIRWAYEHSYERLVTLDCDFTHSPADIPAFLEQGSGHDVTIGSRHMRADSLPGWNLLRRSLTRLGYLLTRTLLGMSYDATGAFRVYNLKTIPARVFAKVTAQGYSFFFESLFVLHRCGFTVRELPIVLPARTYGHSKMTVSDALRSASQVFSLHLASRIDPARFRLSQRTVVLDDGLSDPQHWDEYWNATGGTRSAVYEIIAAIYRNIGIRRRLNAVLPGVFPSGSKLLHAGCGSGQVDADIGGMMKVTAVDISPLALELYSQYHPEAVEVRHASIFKLPFEDASFDGVYNLGVMEHFTDPEIQDILREFRRVLRPGGKALFFWPHHRATSAMVLDFVHWLFNNVLGKPLRLHPPEVTRMRSPAMAADIARRAGMELLDYRFNGKDFWVQACIVMGR